MALGLGRSVEELVRSVSAREIADWGRFYEAEPWGAYRDNLHAGMITSLIYNVNRGKGQKATKMTDFLLIPPDADESVDGETVKFVAGLRALAKPKKVKK